LRSPTVACLSIDCASVLRVRQCDPPSSDCVSSYSLHVAVNNECEPQRNVSSQSSDSLTAPALSTHPASRNSRTTNCPTGSCSCFPVGAPRAWPIAYYGGLWPMVHRKAVLERYAALRCLWHGVGVNAVTTRSRQQRRTKVRTRARVRGVPRHVPYCVQKLAQEKGGDGNRTSNAPLRHVDDFLVKCCKVEPAPRFSYRRTRATRTAHDDYLSY
jgi:hypothetical protein